MVLESWLRCKKLDVQPREKNYQYIPPSEIKRRKMENSFLLESISTLLLPLINNTKERGYRFDFYDQDLFMLDQYGDTSIIELALTRGSFPGVCRAENISGTNAVSLAALYLQAVQINGPEHYKEALHCWTCSAAPIINMQNNELMGVLNIVGHAGLPHQHTLGLAIFLAKAIEQSFFQQSLLARLEMKNSHLNSIVEAINDGIIVIDEQENILLLNQIASNLLQLSNSDLKKKSVQQIFGKNNPLSEALDQEKITTDQEIYFKIGERRKNVVGNIKTVKDQQGKKNVICVFQSINAAKGFVKNFAGLKAHFTFDDIIGKSSSLDWVVKTAKQAAKLPSNFLLRGESGTGKELFAQAIHNASPFCNGPFVALNSAAIPNELIESELFGYEGGAFTGAKKEGRPGKFELAEGGTLFLDEINSMPLKMQSKLLRVLQNKTIMRVGGLAEIPFQARLISASNKDLWEEVKQGNFREDLFYRINVIGIVIPPLRERKEDIELLINYFCQKFGQQLNLALGCSQEGMKILKEYSWPGNVRELENVIERSAFIALSRGSNEIHRQDVVTYSGIRKHIYQQEHSLEKEDQAKIDNTWGDQEKRLLIITLQNERGNVSRVAEKLKIGRNTIYRKLKKYNLVLESFR